MRKKALFFSNFLLTSVAFALYNGSPNLPEMPEKSLFFPDDSPFSLKANYEGDLVLGRKIKSSSLSNPNIHSLFNGAEIAFGFIDRVELYTVLGGFKESITAYKNSSYFKLKTSESFGGEIGARAIAVFWGETKLGFDGKYFYGWPHLNTVELGSQTAKAAAKKTWLMQWQVGAALSQRFGFFTPYIGVNYSRFSLNFENISSDLFSETVEIQNTSPFGFVTGLGLAGEKGPFFDLEARFFDEYAFSVAGGIRF